MIVNNNFLVICMQFYCKAQSEFNVMCFMSCRLWTPMIYIGCKVFTEHDNWQPELVPYQFEKQLYFVQLSLIIMYKLKSEIWHTMNSLYTKVCSAWKDYLFLNSVDQLRYPQNNSWHMSLQYNFYSDNILLIKINVSSAKKC